MNPENKGARQQPGAGGDTNTVVVATVSQGAPESKPEADFTLAARCLHLDLAAALLELHRPADREFAEVRAWWRGRGDLELHVLRLLIEAAAPSAECADPAWTWAVTGEDGMAAITEERMRGFAPAEPLQDACAAFAAVVFARLFVESEATNAA